MMADFQKSISQIIILILLIFANFSCSSPSKLNSHSDTFTQDLFSYLYENRQVLNLCQGEIDLEIAQKNFKTYRIDSQTQLIELICFLGAYQGNYQYLIYQEKPQQTLIKLLTFDIFQETDTGEMTRIPITSLGGLTDYDPQSRSLKVVTKYRGLADCGSWGKYQWDQSEFKLVEYRLKANCDGQYVQPENYAQVYP